MWPRIKQVHFLQRDFILNGRMRGGGVGNNYFEAASQPIFMLIKYLKEEKSSSGLLGLELRTLI